MVYYVHNISGDNARLSAQKIGGKALSLCKMMALGLDVPTAFVFDTNLYREFYENGQELPENFEHELSLALQRLNRQSGKKFGSKHKPFLISVRSGAAVSMPGMMDSLLNIGLDYTALKSDADYLNFSYFMRHYVALIHKVYLDEEVEDHDTLSSRDKVRAYLDFYKEEFEEDFPSDPKEHLKNAIIAVLKSANNRRARTYRLLHSISEDETATAVIVQMMVMGSADGFSGSGVAVSRNPNTGKLPMMGEYMPQMQGEILVAGRGTPESLSFIQKHNSEIYDHLSDMAILLEKEYKRPVEIEFTIEESQLWFLQVRPVKLSDEALVVFTMEMVDKKIFSPENALLSLSPALIERFLHASVDGSHENQILDRGVAASPGAAVGQVVFTAEQAIQFHAEGKSAILVRHETSPEDIHGMYAASGVLTARGGMTSHAAVAARGMGRPCVTGVKNIKIRSLDQFMIAGSTKIHEGDYITINGTTGDVLLGQVAIKQADPPKAFYQLTKMAEQYSRMAVRANIDATDEIKIAHNFNANGIGLYRTEYAFYKENDIHNIRRMVLAEDIQERADIADNMRDMQIVHYTTLFEKMSGQPITIRLLDPPLHEFFPDNPRYYEELAEKLNITEEKLAQRLRDLKEFNPMLGVRGCRVGVLYPEIYVFQLQFLMNAAIEIIKAGKPCPDIEIMIPFVGFEAEFQVIRQQILSVHRRLSEQEPQLKLPKIGAMIELPRAALCAGAIAKTADFLSFGTNDLTQTVLGISRDDSPRFMSEYMRKGLVPFDPFVTLDIEGVGMLIAIAVQKAKEMNPNIKIGLCGEHGAERQCVDFCEMLGMDYVSCSPYRLASARLASAQAHIRAKRMSETHKQKLKKQFM